MREYAQISPVLLKLLVSLGDPNTKIWAVHTFYAFAILLLGGLWPRGADILGITLTVGGLIGVAAWWQRIPWRSGARTWDLMMAATIALGLLISPYVFFYDSMLLLLPLAIVWSCYPQGYGAAGRPLDGGPLLAWTALLYAATFASNLLSAVQLRLSDALGFPPVAVQLSVPVIAGWAWIVARSARSSAAPESVARPLDEPLALAAK
jgi:hypothetical protein